MVYLYATIDQQLERTQRTDNRPLLQDADDREATLRALFEQRDPLYREVADLVIETDNRNARVLAREIEQELSQTLPS